MTGLHPVANLWSEAWRLLCIAGLRWALSEIHPCHPDVPYIVRRLHHLRSTR